MFWTVETYQKYFYSKAVEFQKFSDVVTDPEFCQGLKGNLLSSTSSVLPADIFCEWLL
jgi:hypothetical protein